MNILIIGSGGREHALAWKVAQSQRVRNVFVAPGNAGTALEPKVTNVAIATDDIAALVTFARSHQVNLTIVGPETPLVLGVVDAFTEAGLRCFGPSKQAARLEGSKAFAKDFLARHRIPTADYQTFTEIAPAITYVRKIGTPIVVKADGLAAGKGVLVAHTERDAITAIESLLTGQAFGGAGQRVVIEEFLPGEEVSFIVMADGKHILAMASSQDHKARDNGDQGPNTGGMGAYSPAPLVTPELHRRILQEIIEPTVRALAAEGCHYTGFLYAGLMITPEGTPKVLEYNCRLGDPEAQAIMMRLHSDLVELCEAALNGHLDQMQIDWDPRAALAVVMTAAGYPGPYRKGDIITALPGGEASPVGALSRSNDIKLFHAGTAAKDGQIITCGGRVLCVTALGATVGAAQGLAYDRVKRIQWNGVYYRTDIGYRAIERERDQA